MNDNNQSSVYFTGSIDKSPRVKTLQEWYPILKDIVPQTMASYADWSMNYFQLYFGVNVNRVNTMNDEEGFVIVCNNNYHTIKRDDNIIWVDLK